MSGRAGCWFAHLPGAGPCDGRLVRCHLIPKQLLAREFGKGAYLVNGRWLPSVEARFVRGFPTSLPYRSVKNLQDDERAWVPGCGGPSGLEGHHGMLDGFKLALPRRLLPDAVIEYACELGLLWWIDKHYP